jgi:multiple sugar transport system permease protein
MNARTAHQLRHAAAVTLVTGFTLVMVSLFLSPFAFMVFTSLKTQGQMSIIGAPIWPAAPVNIDYQGKQVGVYTVPLGKCEGFDPNDTSKGNLALVTKGRQASTFIDPNDSQRGEFTCAVSWRALDRPWTWSPTWTNYAEVWKAIDYPRLLWNTFFYALMSNIGTILSCTLVAFGFSRFRFPGRDFMFLLLISTIFLPGAVTIIPTYTFFQKIGWVGSWLPLIVPTFFANAYDVFLLRQYFMTLPHELDEAAMIDGASPFRVLWSVILPQSLPALVAVTVFHIVFAWNDYFGPLIYLSANRQLWPISVALPLFNGIYGSRPELIQAGSMLTLILPLLLFLAAQRFFVQGIVITGVEK